MLRKVHYYAIVAVMFAQSACQRQAIPLFLQSRRGRIRGPVGRDAAAGTADGQGIPKSGQTSVDLIACALCVGLTAFDLA